MLVKEVMTPKEKLVIVSPLESVRSVIKLMQEHKVRSVIVDKSHPSGAYGIVTYKNILQSVVAQDGDIDLLQVYDIATIPAISITGMMDIRYAAKMMINQSIKRLLVIDNNELEGILTMSDIIGVVMKRL